MIFHPFDPDAYPGAGTKIGPAWRTLLTATAPGEWISQLAVMEAMETAGPITRKTATNLIWHGTQHGFLQRRRIPRTRQPRQYEIRRCPTWGEPVPASDVLPAVLTRLVASNGQPSW